MLKCVRMCEMIGERLHAEDAGHEDDDSQQDDAAVRRHAANAARFAHHAVRGVIAGH